MKILLTTDGSEEAELAAELWAATRRLGLSLGDRSCFFTAREQVERDVPRVSLPQTVDTVRQNRPLAMLCLSSLLFLTGMFSIQTIGIYYARDVLGNASLYAVLVLVQTAGTFLAAFLIPWLSGTIGKKHTYILGGAIGILGGIGVALAPASIRPSRSSCGA